MSKLVIIGVLVVALALTGAFIIIDKVKGDENASGQICPDKGEGSHGGDMGMHGGEGQGMHSGGMSMNGSEAQGEGHVCDHEGEEHQGGQMDEMISNGQLKEMIDSGQFEKMHGAEKAAEVKKLLESGDTAALKAYMEQIQGSHQQ